jgi:hypothetical protein
MGWMMYNGKFTFTAPAEAGDYTTDPAYVNIANLQKDAAAAFAAHKSAVAEGKAEYDPNFMKPYLDQIDMATTSNAQIKSTYDSAQAKIDSGKAAAAAAEKKAEAKRQADLEEARSRAAAEASAQFLESSAKTSKETADKRMSGLYGGMETNAKTRLDILLKQLGADTTVAQKAVTGAADEFTKNFQGSTAFQNVPVAQFNVGESPLLAALQQQGAGTEQVQAATNLANQSMGAASDLQKWAMSQLNVGQQNFDTSVKNTNAQALQAALQQLASRGNQISSGLNADYTSTLDKIASERASAQESSDQQIQKLIDAAAAERAKAIAAFGQAPAAGSQGARTQAVATAPNQYPNFNAAVSALNPNFDPKKAGKTAAQAFPALAASFGVKK